MKKIVFIISLLIPLIANSAIDFNNIKIEVENRKALFPNAIAWKIVDSNVNEDEKKALDFLYSSMPLSDLLLWDGDFYLRNVRQSLTARNEMNWGKIIPDDVFYHFVLPIRGNNEYLDDFRTTYYDELKQRVVGLSLYDAALEINHWCHEKVTYEPSDVRTSSPMATMKTAKGRCGEESVFTVAALRTVGIPARQVYTPRWAHTDNNHAWVEVWVDGNWYFLGACEPEPILNRAWFNNPVSRGMLMHTRVFGDYKGHEQIISRQSGITEINVVDNYVPTHLSTVKLVDENGNILPNYIVEFKIYNYAEFYTAVRVTTDAEGKARLLTGIGDMIVWASKGNHFGFAKINGGETILALNHVIGKRISMDIDIIPPKEGNIDSNPTDEQIAENARRFAIEDSIRNAYTATFFSQEFAPVEEKICDLLTKAKGNWREIKLFLESIPEQRFEEAIEMLYAVSEKDLRDTPAAILLSHINYTERIDSEHYTKYILNPRISNELLSDYRLTLRKYFNTTNPTEIITFITNNIVVMDKYNPYNVPITPTAVLLNNVADRHSRDIFFVAVCRSNGIPARINEINGSTQYHDGNQWIDVTFDKAENNLGILPKGILKATYKPISHLADPQYYRHFTISDLSGGSPKLLEFDENDVKWSNTLKNGYLLNEGYYLVVTGSRMANGSVMAHMEFLNVADNDTTEFPLTMRHNETEISVIGEMDAEKLYTPHNSDIKKSILSTTGRGYFLIVILDKTNEPSNHAVLELQAATDLINEWDRPVLVLSDICRKELESIKQLHYGYDDGTVAKMLRSGVNSDREDLPIIVIADSFGRIVFESQGYDTSLFEKLNNVIPKL